MTRVAEYLRTGMVFTAATALAGFAVSAQAQEAAPTHSVWTDAGVTYSNRTSATAGFEGEQAVFSAGIDTQLGETGVLGAFGSLENSLYTTTDATGLGQTWSHGAGFGVYAGEFYFDSIFANATVHYQHLHNSFTLPGTSANYATKTLSASLSATGFYQFDYFRLSPNATVSYAREWQDGYTETSGAVSPARVTDTLNLGGGIEAGYTVFVDETRYMEPWVGAGFNWKAFENANPAPTPNLDPVSDFDVRLGAGVNTSLSSDVTIGLRGEVSGLTTSNYVVVSAGGQISGRF